MYPPNKVYGPGSVVLEHEGEPSLPNPTLHAPSHLFYPLYPPDMVYDLGSVDSTDYSGTRRWALNLSSTPLLHTPLQPTPCTDLIWCMVRTLLIVQVVLEHGGEP